MEPFLEADYLGFMDRGDPPLTSLLNPTALRYFPSLRRAPRPSRSPVGNCIPSQLETLVQPSHEVAIWPSLALSSAWNEKQEKWQQGQASVVQTTVMSEITPGGRECLQDCMPFGLLSLKKATCHKLLYNHCCFVSYVNTSGMTVSRKRRKK